MTTREDVLKYCLSFPDTYQDAPFHDENWQLVRYRKNKKVFAWTYFREGKLCVNVKVDPEWRDLWRRTYAAVIPGYHFGWYDSGGRDPKNDCRKLRLDMRKEISDEYTDIRYKEMQ